MMICQDEQSSIRLQDLYVFDALLKQAAKDKLSYEKLVVQVNIALEKEADRHPKLTDKLHELKLEIRLMTRGIPVTEPLDSASSQPLLKSDPNFNEQQFNAYSILLKKAYKAAAQIAHPDKGGTQADFAEVKEAYANRDLSQLTSIYLRLQKSRNLYWQQSEQGIDYASTEMNRSHKRRTVLQSQPIFAIARLHLAGQFERASHLMAKHLVAEIQALLNEIEYLRNQNGQDCD